MEVGNWFGSQNIHPRVRLPKMAREISSSAACTTGCGALTMSATQFTLARSQSKLLSLTALKNSPKQIATFSQTRAFALIKKFVSKDSRTSTNGEKAAASLSSGMNASISLLRTVGLAVDPTE